MANALAASMAGLSMHCHCRASTPTSISLIWILLLHEGTEPFLQRYGIQSAYPAHSL